MLAKAVLNFEIFDVEPGELRRQLQYKPQWYGSQRAMVDRWTSTSNRCSACAAVKAKLRQSERTYHCPECGLVIDLDVNAARNIAILAQQCNG